MSAFDPKQTFDLEYWHRQFHSGSILASATIFAHFLISEATKVFNSSGELATGSMPTAINLAAISLSASASRNAALSLSIIAFGVLAGANAANHAVSS